ncbi:MAG: putative metal-binding motif-containing protein [Candidatus Polarisedimenticolia bacterium]
MWAIRLAVLASVLGLGYAAAFADPPAPPIAPSCPQFPPLNLPGVLCETFDTNRNGVPGFQWSRLPLGADPSDPLRAIGDPDDDVLGYTMTGGASPLGTAGVICSDDMGGFVGCQAPVAEENDWHLHSPFEGPGAGYTPPGQPVAGAPDGGKAHSGYRSMHMGRHLHPTTTIQDTLRLRQVSAFVLDSQGDPGIPGVVPGPASTMEFWHMISVPDDENFGAPWPPNSFGGGQVQVSLLGHEGQFERWKRLTPAVNGYDTTIQEVVSLCGFDPGDDQIAPADQTMCDFSPMWADLGDVFGMDTTCTTDTDDNDSLHKDCGAISGCTPGPGCTENGSVGAGVWARSTFNLSHFAGRVARLRWIGMVEGGWSFGTQRSALEPDPGGIAYQYYDGDDGWWIDDIMLTDLRQAPTPCSEEDGDGDGFTECTGDCDDTRPAVYPGAPPICDGLDNDCSDGLWPTLPPAEVDADGDGLSPCQGDCNDARNDLQAVPSPVTLDVAFDAGTGQTTLTWTPPTFPGGTNAVRYDVLVHDSPFGLQAASCAETNETNRFMVEPASQPIPFLRFYFVRAQNSCPGAWNGGLGTRSDGTLRCGRGCGTEGPPGAPACP